VRGPVARPSLASPSRSLGVAALLCGALVSACGEVSEPPGRNVHAEDRAPKLTAPEASATASAASKEADLEPGQGDKIASIAMRTWVYQQPKAQATKLGYLRAGAVVERARKSAGQDGCAGGWYRVEPRGYVCNGKGASLELDHPVVQAALRGPRRGEPMPYRYVVSRKPPPHLYFKLPSEEEQKDAEGKRRAESMALYGRALDKLLGEPDPTPEFLARGEPLPKPYGAKRPLHYRTHRGRANEGSAFGVIASFDWTGRRMGLTTELDLIPLDRTTIAPLSELRGIVIDKPGTPAFVIHHGVHTYHLEEGGEPREGEPAPYRSGWVLTGKHNGSSTGLLETTAGVWLPYGSLRIAKLREDPAGFSREGRKWISVSIRRQMLVAYEGTRPVYSTLVSTGRGEMGDPETTHATVRGTYMIHAKHIAGTMDGDSTTEESFDLRDVPYIQYFHQGYALHGAYWHDRFGKVRSHGCINLAPADAAWLFEWTDPQVPEGWHGAVNLKAGTLVYTHP